MPFGSVQRAPSHSSVADHRRRCDALPFGLFGYHSLACANWATSLALDLANAYYRLAIWEYGTANVMKNPWFGVPLDGSWERPDWMYSPTVDHYWLATALSGGLPTVALYILAIGTLFRAVYANQSEQQPIEQRRCRHAWSAAVLVLCFVGTTVHFWREIEVFFTLLLGMGGALIVGAGRKDRMPSPDRVRSLIKFKPLSSFELGCKWNGLYSASN